MSCHNTETADTLRNKLLAMQAELSKVTDISDAEAAPVKLDQTSVGRLSCMDAMQAQAMAKATQGRRTAQLRAIQSAIVRLDNNEYGICLECDEPINPKRLEVDPVATFCIRCAELVQPD